jgi:virginiamycin B lyase
MASNSGAALSRAALLSLAVALVLGCGPAPQPSPLTAAAGGDPGAGATRPGSTLPASLIPASSIAVLPAPIDVSTAGGTALEGTFAIASMVLAGGKAWIAGVGDGIGVLDAAGRLTRSVAADGACAGMDTGFGSIWTAMCNPAGIVRVDSATGRVQRARLDDPIAASLASIGAGEGAVWLVAGSAADQLLGIDPNTLEVAARYAISPGGDGVRAGFGGVWVTRPGADEVLRLDGTSGQSVSIHVPGGPTFLALGAGAVWVLGRLGSVTRVDPATNSVVATIRLGSSGEGGIAVGGGRVWIRGGSDLLTAIDAATNEVVARYGPASGTGTVAADGDAVWATAPDVAMIWRLPFH